MSSSDLRPARESENGAPALRADRLTIGYGERTIARGLALDIARGSFTAIIGPNACGKSTLLKALSRVLAPSAGSVLLDGRDIASMRPREVATRLGLLPQTALAPDGIVVEDLVARGRFPHRGILRRWSAADDDAVRRALEATRTADLADRLVDELSGGQRQRVWIAMLLAQEAPLMLLDEPTTFLDMAHQYELLDLLGELHADGATLVAVLHDLNQAARYATDLVVMKEGRIHATGSPGEILTPEMLAEVFAMECLVIEDPATGTPLVVPEDTRRRRGGGRASAEQAAEPSATKYPRR